jgi:adenine-specific DNA-methyltransferase
VVSLNFNGKNECFEIAFKKPLFEFYEHTTNYKLTNEILKNENILIKCDNLETLKYIKKLNFKFDIIYIDPPYNSGLKFIYNDCFKEQNLDNNNDIWLNMMMPRLLLAREILDESGIMFVSIDEREFASLTILMREIFGRENHIGTLKWRKKRKPSFLNKHISNVIEYILVFSSHKGKLLKLIGKELTEKNRPVLNSSNIISNRILKKNTIAKCPDGTYLKGEYINRTLKIHLDSDATILNGKLLNDVHVKGRFRVSQEILDNCVFITKNFGLRRKVLKDEIKFKQATDDLTVDCESNEDGEFQLKKIFHGEKVFDFPKPVGLIKHLISMYQNPKSKIINCLDFFAGSATLAQAVHELNQYEVKYKFCCVQNEEAINNKIKNFTFKNVAEITEKRINLVEENNEIFPRCKIFSPICQNDE